MDEYVRDHHAFDATPASCSGRGRGVRHRPHGTVRPAPARPVAPGGPAGPGGTRAPGGPAARRGFWGALSPAQQAGFLAAARPVRFMFGDVLWHEGESADHVIVIRSGEVRVSVRLDGRERPLAIRGPGDIIGERASLGLGRRSATIVALDDVHAIVMPTREFAWFVTRHPQVLNVLEDDLYGRLAERSGPDTTDTTPDLIAPCANHVCIHGAPHAALHQYGPRPQSVPGTATAPHWAGRNCTIVFTDIAGYSAAHRDDRDRLAMKHSMYALLHEAFRMSNVPWDACYHEDRGDGALIVVPPSLPTASVVDPLLAWLAARLRWHNGRSGEIVRYQLRLALHVGPVMPDGHGVSGSQVIQTARLLDAAPFKDRLAATGADLGVIVSDFVYDSYIAHSPGYVNRDVYEPMTCKVKETEVSGWMHLHGAPPLRTVT
ncbi:hypothetical protein BJF79_32805 [Actinomadura sp. CNU-125]|uniref:cyclic nucleotide-binding domain-containing protein n=1 Tax=Actinomadura sp. CNU-125 TaxID=1904961 RepID=UPI000960EC08|nr:cyclic nucleotide-binding domain-containing protein [Actinomadura sp. CNU-125]OLT34921.1 hypothetical protein BJF79_32805 [Actinomadura sp. CNU-125]